jgi:hypothetical protein
MNSSPAVAAVLAWKSTATYSRSCSPLAYLPEPLKGLSTPGAWPAISKSATQEPKGKDGIAVTPLSRRCHRESQRLEVIVISQRQNQRKSKSFGERLDV